MKPTGSHGCAITVLLATVAALLVSSTTAWLLPKPKLVVLPPPPFLLPPPPPPLCPSPFKFKKAACAAKRRKLACRSIKKRKKLIAKQRKKVLFRKKLLCKKAMQSRSSPLIAAPLSLGTAGTTAVFGGIGLAAAVANQLSDDSRPTPFTPTFGSLEGQTIVITGGTSGLGLESAKRLASGGANIVLTARSVVKGEEAVEKVERYLSENGYSYDEQMVSFRVLDLDNLEAVKLAAEWDVPGGKIDVLLNNAGIMALPNREVTVDGFERQVQTNHLGHFVLTAMLAPKFADSARIVTVSSSAHQAAFNGIEFDYFWKAESSYSPWKSYGQSKLANILFTKELQRRAEEAGKDWTAVTLHPGAVNTNLARYTTGNNQVLKQLQDNAPNALKELSESVTNRLLKTPEQGASTQIFLAAKAEDEDAKGEYFVDCIARPLQDYAKDESAAKRLWEESERLGGVAFSI